MSLETLPIHWKDLVEQLYLLRPIRRKGDYNRAIQIAARLAAKTVLNKDQADYLESLVTLIEAYERKSLVVRKKDSLANLKFLMEANQLTASDLGRILGQRQLGAKILSRNRDLSKAHIKKLATHFAVDPGLFL